MSELAAFQRRFADELEQSPPAISPIRIYLNTVLLGALDALSANFPITCEIVGQRSFEAIALAYARHSPPTVPVLALYGSDFPEWLAGQNVNRELPYIADVARCEQLRNEALFAAEAPVLLADTLSVLGSDQLLGLRLRTHPATRFGWFATPAMQIWLAHERGFSGELAPEWRSGGAIFTRQANEICGFELDPPSHRLLVGMRVGETLGTAVKAASQLYPDHDPGACFGRLINCGAFAALPN